MRNLAGSLLAGLLLHFHPLFAQEEFIASIDFQPFISASDDLDAPSEFSNSDSSDHINEWDFVDWDSGSFNPYRDQDLTKPFYIRFDEDFYEPPVPHRMVVTSRYGWRDGQLHRGIDIDLVTGDEVYAMLDGKVRYVRSHAGHGKTVVIRHKNGLETIYAHLSKQLVEENQIVKKGEVIGKGGTTGNARGSHLHLEVRYEGVTINPEYFFDFEKGQEIMARESWVTNEVTDPRRFSSFKKASLSVERELKQEEPVVLEVEVPVEAQKTQESEPVTTALPSGELASTALETEPGGPYTIRYGDTLYSLARKHHTTVEEICRVNGIRDSFKIQVGQEILLDF